VVRLVSAWALVVPSALWLAVRASGTGAGTWIETAIVLTPFVALGSVVVLAVVAALRVRPAFVAAAGTCVGYGVVMAPLFVPGPLPSYPPRGPELRVMTVNVQFGWADAEDVVALVEEADVDVLGVQELTPAFDAALRRAGLEDLLPHGEVEAEHGPYGAGLYSRFRVRTADDGITGRHRSPTGLVDVPGAPPVAVSVVHPTPPVGAAGLAEWGATLASLPRPGDPLGGDPVGADVVGGGADEAVRLLIGDFNATVDQPTLRDLLADGYVDAAGATGRGWVTTWRFSFTPPLALDHVLVDEQTAVRDVAVHGVDGSDHRAVVASLRLPAG
jgi:endonuclease/exonuclease/phosphatase family metal-dependent hydrolase